MKKLLVLLSLVCSLPLAAQDYKLWYDKPASRWLEALPIGNSQLGAMIYGGTDTEEIQLNEETFWTASLLVRKRRPTRLSINISSVALMVCVSCQWVV